MNKNLVLGIPHPTSKPSLVSSTPHPTRRHKLTFELEKDDISPITTKADETGKAAKQPRVVYKHTKPIAEVVDKVVLRKKKCTVPQEKESTSSAVLKEMGVKLRVKPTNSLSSRWNMYHMLPHPVILDSDEEIDFHKKATSQATKQQLGKKDDVVKPSASSVEPTDVNKKRGLSKKPYRCITKDQNKIKIVKEASKEMTSTKETPLSSSSKSGAIKKNPLRKLTTDGSTLQAAKAKHKQTTTVKLISDSDDEDSMLPVKCTPRKLLSRFSDIVFYPGKNLNKGVAFARSLVAGSSEFGYIEVSKAKLLRGKQKNTTFMMIEGKVKAVFQGKSVNLSHGDILHINEGSGYQLHNLGTGPARLLYVKEKHS